MPRRTIILVATLLALIVAGMFGFAYLKQQELKQAAQREADRLSEQVVTERYGYLDRIEALHEYRDGIHTISGNVILPSPCESLTVEAAVAESYPEQVTLQFITSEDSEFCAQVRTPAPFAVEVDASAAATFGARFQGHPIPLRLSSLNAE